MKAWAADQLPDFERYRWSRKPTVSTSWCGTDAAKPRDPEYIYAIGRTGARRARVRKGAFWFCRVRRLHTISGKPCAMNNILGDERCFALKTSV